METVTWTADMESCLFYAIMDHKPVGMYECTYSGYFTLAILNYKNLATVFLKKLLFILMNLIKGENKHFNMIFIYEKYNNLCEKKLNAEQIWNHLNILYDLQALVSGFCDHFLFSSFKYFVLQNDTEAVPFPNEETEFSLPNNESYEILKKNVEPAEAPVKPKGLIIF